ncbi:MAG: hypothetical protein QOI95_3876 [Acidimicrobiaceae bacterium]|jgi:predicted ATPase/class 3 adenylate cyclase
MSNLPAGTVTFLFTDIEGSTRRWESDPDGMRAALVRHDDAIESAVVSRGGHVFKHTGDGMCAAFTSVPQAIEAAVEAQRALAAGELRARMGIHTGQAEPVGNDYFGTPLNRCARIMGAAHGGQIVCSATTASIADRVAGVTLRDLGSHRLRDLGEPQQLFQVVHPELGDNFPPLRALDVHRHNLPVPRTRFIGRERELMSLVGALAGGRLVTVTGVGGSGKTRLALHAAADVMDAYTGGVFLVELAAVTEADAIVPRIADAVGLRGVGVATDEEAVLRFLATKTTLLVLDNCEHLLDASAALCDRLLSNLAGITLLCTSREPLAVSGEQVVRIPSLAIAKDDAGVNAVAASEAGQLFADRAVAVHPGFTIDVTNAPAVAQICRRLDGMPLAIELAAARVRHLSVTQIADRLDDRFRLLTGGGRSSLPRHQTLRAALDWSHDLLTEQEQVLFRRLSVFVGWFTLAAAEGVCGDESLDERDVFDVLGRLVDRSLVTTEEAAIGELRFRLLETMRHYAQERVVGADEATAVRDRHRDWFADRCLHRPMTATRLYRDPEVVADYDNLRAAFEWAIATEAPEAASALLLGLGHGWIANGLHREAATSIAEVVDAPWVPPTSLGYATALLMRSGFTTMAGDFALALEQLEEAEAVIERFGYEQLVPELLLGRSIAVSVVRSVPEGEQLLEESAERAIALSMFDLAADALTQLAGYRLARDPAGAVAALERAVVLELIPSSRRGVLASLAQARLFAGEDAAAIAAASEAMSIKRAGDPTSEVEWVLPVAIVFAAAGRLEEAREIARNAWAVIGPFQIPLTATAYLVGLGAMEVFGGDADLGLRLLSAARGAFGKEGGWRAPIVGATYVRSVAHGRTLVGEEAAKRAREEGLQLTGEEALALVL